MYRYEDSQNSEFHWSRRNFLVGIVNQSSRNTHVSIFAVNSLSKQAIKLQNWCLLPVSRQQKIFYYFKLGMDLQLPISRCAGQQIVYLLTSSLVRKVHLNVVSSAVGLFEMSTTDQIREIRSSAKFILIAMCFAIFTDTFIYGMVILQGQINLGWSNH